MHLGVLISIIYPSLQGDQCIQTSPSSFCCSALSDLQVQGFSVSWSSKAQKKVETAVIFFLNIYRSFGIGGLVLGYVAACMEYRGIKQNMCSPINTRERGNTWLVGGSLSVVGQENSAWKALSPSLLLSDIADRSRQGWALIIKCAAGTQCYSMEFILQDGRNVKAPELFMKS